MAERKQLIQEQILKNLSQPTASIEQRVVQALNENGEYHGHISEEELVPILSNVLYTLVAQQKVAGVDVPIEHNVTQMSVHIEKQEIRVFCELHIHSPIKAFIKFKYRLINDPAANPSNLRLKNGDIQVEEVTRRLDFKAKTALKVMNVRRIAMHEMSDPARVIKHTLPEQLVRHGFDGTLSRIDLEITPQNTLDVSIFGGNASDG